MRDVEWERKLAFARSRLRWEVGRNPEPAVDLEHKPPKEDVLKSHVLLLSRVLEDLGTWCCTSTTNDINYIVRRVKNEGESFLTITLPTFGKDFESCLDQREVDPTLFKSFKKRACLPAFAQGFTSQVFDQYTGALLGNPSVDAIRAIRQISYLFKKLELPCTSARTFNAYTQYVECDNQVRKWTATHTGSDLVSEFRLASSVLLGDLLTRVDRKVYDGEVIPKHGPGATADRIKANAKYDNRVWTDRLEELFPAGDFLYTSWSHFVRDETGPIWLEPGKELPVRVVSVPKTLKTPRIIAIEPTCMQYVQQGLMEIVNDEIRRDDLLSEIIGTDDQVPNQVMACHGSFHLDLATLDLSEASDRVPNLLVSEMLTIGTNTLRDAVDACRSRRADVPGHGIVPLAKFASMGSALTFPMEELVFATIIFMGIADELSVPLTRGLVKRYSGSVRVFGDDLIVPKEFVHSVINRLEAFGLKVNRDKSFWTGRFRESCGKDYYDGIDVSVVKLGKVLPSSRRHAREIASAVAARNLLFEAGYVRTVEYLDHLIEQLIPFPRVVKGSPGLGRHTYNLDYDVERYDPRLQVPLVKAAVLDGPIPSSSLDGVGALLKYFLKRGDHPLYDEKHLERAGRPSVVNIKLKWVPPY